MDPAPRYYCEDCLFTCVTKSDWIRHCETQKHCITKQGQITECSYFCNVCNIHCYKKSDWDRHCHTKKHLAQKKKQSRATNPYRCDSCHRVYTHYSSYWKHLQTKKCMMKENEDEEEEISNPFTADFVMKLIQDHGEWKNIVLEQQKALFAQQATLTDQNKSLTETIVKLVENGVGVNTISTTTITSNHTHSKSFNLNFFLNETCKNAMNMNDFCESIVLQLDDLEHVGEVGYVKGIADITVRKLNDLDVSVRPLHCVDKKRETTYVKDGGKWQKEDESKSKTRQLVETVVYKNCRLLTEFKEKYPDCVQSHSPYSDQYNILTVEACGGEGDGHVDRKNDKIIHRVVQQFVIEK